MRERSCNPASDHRHVPIALEARGLRVIILIGCLIAAPNLLTRQQLAALPAWLPKKQVALGLDLRGGSHLVVEIDAAALHASSSTRWSTARGARCARRASAPRSSVSSQVVVARIAERDAPRRGQRVLRKLVSTVSLSAFTEAQRDLDVKLRPDGAIELRPTKPRRSRGGRGRRSEPRDRAQAHRRSRRGRTDDPAVGRRPYPGAAPRRAGPKRCGKSSDAPRS